MRSRLPRLIIAAPLAARAPAAGASSPSARREQPEHVRRPAVHSALGAKHARLVVVLERRHRRRDDELNRVIAVPRTRRSAAGVTPLVTFEHARGDATICNRRANRKKAPVQAADGQAVRGEPAAVQGALPARPHVVRLERDQPLHAADVQEPEGRREVHDDRAQGLQGRHRRRAPTSSTRPTTRAPSDPTFRVDDPLREGASARPTRAPRSVCGVHNYSDVNRFRQTGTKALIKALGCKQIWLTETGGLVQVRRLQGRRSARQLKATKYMFKVAAPEQEDQARSTSTPGSAAVTAALRRRPRGRRASRARPTPSVREHL